MKVLVISDSHGKNRLMEQVIEKETGLDRIIHLGDLEGAEDFLEAIAPCPVEMVCGNNDFFTPYPKEKIVEMCGHRIFICHGHYYCVSMGIDRIAAAAKQRGCDMVMFGHTHCPEIETVGDVMVVNPGSISYPRQENHKPSYIIMEMDEKGTVGFSLRFAD